MKKIPANDGGVSPVIATILMVAITVVLAAVLYVMVMGMTTSTPAPDMPLGLNQQARNDTSVTILISKAPTTARVYASTLSITHDGNPSGVNATLYYANGTVVAHYVDGDWVDLPDNETHYQNGMLIQVTASAVAHGDYITIAGDGFGISKMTID